MTTVLKKTWKMNGFPRGEKRFARHKEIRRDEREVQEGGTGPSERFEQGKETELRGG